MKTKYNNFCQELFTRVLYSDFILTTFHSVKNDQQGQTLVEFILLLAVISLLSFMFLKIINNNISLYWLFFVQKVVDDPSVKIRI